MVFFLYNYPMNNILDKEVWKDIIGYEGLYQVSNFGNVRSLNYNGTKGNIRILTPLHNYGYLCVHLSKDGFTKTVRIHRLVLEAFIPNPDNLPVINHKDENKTNNFVWVNDDGSIDPEKSNLEWCTVAYNISYGTAIERRIKTNNKSGGPKAERHIAQIDLNGSIINIWKSAHDAGRNGYTYQCVDRCARGIRKTHKGYYWKFLN